VNEPAVNEPAVNEPAVIQPERSAVFAKLQLKQQTPIVVLNSPASFEAELGTLTGVIVARDTSKVAAIDFALAFATTQQQVDEAARSIASRLHGDGLVWVAYPKRSSKRYTCEFNRDTGWAVLGELGFEPVRQVAIDHDWSALRFRRVEFIKTMTRAVALTEVGKSKTKH
jgi:hypothetical protein